MKQELDRVKSDVETIQKARKGAGLALEKQITRACVVGAPELLVTRLADPDPVVRRDAATAIG